MKNFLFFLIIGMLVNNNGFAKTKFSQVKKALNLIIQKAG